MKNMVLLILAMIVNLSCTSISHTELMNDSDALKVFNEEEIHSLELIVNFFDSFILENTEKAQDISQAYYQYFETIKNSGSIEDLSRDIGLSNSDATKALIKKLKDNGIFYEIWNYAYGYDFETKDTLSVELELNQQSKYVQLLELLGKNNNFFGEYNKHLQSSGTISPGNIALFMKYFREIEFQKEVNRLVFAIHYITIVSDKEYKNR